jgi:hypothetical protein
MLHMDIWKRFGVKAKYIAASAGTLDYGKG